MVLSVSVGDERIPLVTKLMESYVSKMSSRSDQLMNMLMAIYISMSMSSTCNTPTDLTALGARSGCAFG